MALVAYLVYLYSKNICFSNTAYALMFILPFWHTIGGHYTFERVPFDWFNDFFGFERNMFDRIGHFSVGFYALPIIEYLVGRGLVAKKWIAVTYAIFAIAFVAVSYEWIEWWLRNSGEEVLVPRFWARRAISGTHSRICS